MSADPASLLSIRPATPADADGLARLAARDTAPALTGEILLAHFDSRLVAAVSLTNGRSIADPFVPTADALAVLRFRARQERRGRRVRALALRRPGRVRAARA